MPSLFHTDIKAMEVQCFFTIDTFIMVVDNFSSQNTRCSNLL